MPCSILGLIGNAIIAINNGTGSLLRISESEVHLVMASLILTRSFKATLVMTLVFLIHAGSFENLDLARTD